MKNTVTVTINGNMRSGKTTIGKLIYEFFKTMGIEVKWEDDMLRRDTGLKADKYPIDYSKLDREKQLIIIKSTGDIRE